MPRCTNCNDTGWLLVGRVPERCGECEMTENKPDLAAAPGGAEALCREILAGDYEGSTRAEKLFDDGMRQAATLILAELASPAAETAPDAGLVEALRAVVSGWEALPGGDYPPMRVQSWLVKDMKPAIDAARVALSRAGERT